MKFILEVISLAILVIYAPKVLFFICGRNISLISDSGSKLRKLEEWGVGVFFMFVLSIVLCAIVLLIGMIVYGFQHGKVV